MTDNDFLYHGSKFKLEKLLPHKAHGGNAGDQQKAIYATSNKNLALLFTFHILPDGNGLIHWETDFQKNTYFMKLLNGKIDFKTNGFLYKVPADKFQKLDEIQWITKENISPISYELIDPSEYKHLIINDGKLSI